MDIKPGLTGNLQRAVLVFCVVMTSCLFESKQGRSDLPGFLNLDLQLKPNAHALLKTASADTIFNLDSLIIILSTTGGTDARYSYTISGRSDTGNLSVTSKIYTLSALRSWKATILTIDTTLNPSRQDTVHRDSITFTINPGDTTFVTKTVNPAYAILRARLVSTSAAQITHNVKFVRIKVDGTSQDSMQIGPALRGLSFGNTTNGATVGDSGTLLTSTNRGVNWTPVTSGTTANLNAVRFPTNSAAWAVGDGGTVLKTTNLTTWSTVGSGTTVKLNATYFTAANNGWVVGEGGTIRKTTTGTSFIPQTSGTAVSLNGIYMSGANTGHVVGNDGVILRTIDGGTGWTSQSSGTSRNLNAIHLASASTGYVVGDSGTILKTITTGGTWTAQTSGTTQNLRAVFFTSTSAGYIVGDGGTVLTTTNGGTNWTLRTSGTSLDLFGVAWTSNNSGGALVGDKASVSFTTNGTAWTFQPYGTKLFDVQLTYKYFTPNLSHSLLMDAIDTLGGTLRGYQATNTILLAPGKDTTVTPNSSLVKCGYGGVTPACN